MQFCYLNNIVLLEMCHLQDNSLVDGKLGDNVSEQEMSMILGGRVLQSIQSSGTIIFGIRILSYA